jgi:hypothetical protein
MSASKKIRQLSLRRAKELLNYDPSSGELRWRVDRFSGRNKVQAAAGSVAGHRHVDGYIRVKIDKVVYHAQHIIWLLQTGRYPSREIDHKDGDTYNNRWKNFRLATTQENGRNRGVHKSNTSGAKGVDRHKGKWRSRIIVDYKQIHLGSFYNFEDAVKARLNAEQLYFGEFNRAT